MEYGLIGAKLKHSFSKYLHEEFLNTEYELKELDASELDKFFLKKDFKGINVTIPYKSEVIKYLDYKDDLVAEINACNCIVNKNGKLYGYNTDYYGFKYLLLKNSVDVENMTVAILGSGGTYNTCKAVCKDLNAKEIYCVSRKETKETISYEQLEKMEVDILINTTPLGMYPNNYESKIDFSKLKVRKVVIDVIFNPLKTKLLIDAKRAGIKTIGGLDMLIAQGVYASELFLNKEYAPSLIHDIYLKIIKEKYNIVLIGMPMSGKTTLGLLLEKYLDKKFVDIDKEIVNSEKMSITEIFETKGEDYFRVKEREMYDKYSKENGMIISTGGGIVKSLEAVEKMKQNGFIVFLDRKIDKLIKDNTRPLVKSKEDIERLYKERYDLYKNNCDVQIVNNGSKKIAVIKIVEAFYEYIGY